MNQSLALFGRPPLATSLDMTINIRGYDVLIDGEDFDRVMAKHWTPTCKRGLVYFANGRNGWGDGFLSLHRFIINAPKGSIVDHIDGNTLNNRKSNLRICTKKGNARNRKLCFDNKLGIRGVVKNKKRYKAHIFFNQKSFYLGNYLTKKEASDAYEYAAKLIYKEYYREPQNVVEVDIDKKEFFNVKIMKQKNDYAVRIPTIDGKRIYTRGFNTEEEALLAYQRAKEEIYQIQKGKRKIALEDRIKKILDMERSND
jgi:hypothetical protein